MSHRKGLKAENHFSSLMNRLGIQNEFVDQEYDFIVSNMHKVEVKSCNLSICAHANNYQCGRFDFTDTHNRKFIMDNKVFVCFIVKYEEQFMVLGVIRADNLWVGDTHREGKRYFSIHDITRRCKNKMTIEEFACLVTGN